MGKRKFEEHWRDRFSDDVETDVSDSVWKSVEVNLIQKENQTNKRRVILYQALAASIALFAIALASYIGFVMTTEPTNTKLAFQQTEVSTESKREEAEVQDQLAENPITKPADHSITKNSKTIGKNQIGGSQLIDGSKPDQMLLLADVGDEEYRSETAVVNMERIEPYVTNEYAPPTIPEYLVKLNRTQFYPTNFPRKLPAMPSFYMAEKEKKHMENENLWASLGFAGGSYDPGSVSGGQEFLLSERANDFQLANAVQPESTQASLGTSYSIGVNIGKRISNRWIILTGIGYMRQNIEYRSNYTSVSPDNSLKVAVAEYLDSDFAPITVSSPYTILSTNEFLSIPLQAGYIIINRKIGLQTNAGISTDFFLKNTLRDESGGTEGFSQSAGEDSPYRSVNWSGLFGFELSHKLADRYRLAIVPGVRYNFNSILKDDTELAYNPLVLDIGFRLRYVFK